VANQERSDTGKARSSLVCVMAYIKDLMMDWYCRISLGVACPVFLMRTLRAFGSIGVLLGAAVSMLKVCKTLSM